MVRNKLTSLSFYSLLKGLLYGWFGLFIGGRVFYVLFYYPSFFLNHPEKIFQIWSGGMSFHGGILGVILGGWLASKKYRFSFFQFSDLVCLFAPLGLFFGRIGNFINGELAGRVSDVSWAVIFPKFYDENPRHPSQLYEALGEGLFLFIILWAMRNKLNTSQGVISGSFLVGYGIIRFFIEFYRMPDKQLGFILGPFSMGQVLCSLMIIIGIIILKNMTTSSENLTKRL